MTPAPNARRTVSLSVAAVVIGLLAASWVITSGLRHRAATASQRVEAVTAATAQLSKLENTEAAFFTGSTTLAQVNFDRLLANVLTSAHAINDMAANGLLASYVDQADRVVRLIMANDVAQAAYVEQAGQQPAGNLLIGAYNRYAAKQATAATSTEASAADLSQAVQWGALALVALALLAFWWLDSRTERERARAVERTEARYRGIVARGSDALFLVDATGAVTFASESVRGVLGRDVDDAARPAFASLFPADEAPGLDAALASARADPEHPASVSVTLDEPDKRYLEVVVNDRLEDPSIGAVVVSARDLTDRKQAESALARSEALTQDLIDHTPALVYVKDLSGRYQRVNKAWAQAMGKSVAQTLGKGVDEIFTPTTARALAAADEAVVSRGAYEAEFDLDVDGRRKTFLTSRFPLVDAAGQVYAVGGVSIDITDRAREVDLERTLGSMMSRSGDAIFTTSGGDITFVNRAAEELTGFSALELIGAPPTIFAAPGHEVEQARLWTAVRRGDTIQGAATSIRTKDGAVIPVEVTLTPQRGPEGEVVGVSGIVRDVTERRRESEELARAARTDALTGLPNRTALLHHLARVAQRARRDGDTAALLFFDLDHFKDINDQFKAHDAGNAMLQAMATRVRDAIRPTDFAARLHGDEFVVVCYPVSDQASVEEIARRVADAVAEPVEFQGHRLSSTASVGVALSSAAGAETWLAQGDAAMYEAKRQGRQRIVVYAEGMALLSPDRSSYPQPDDDPDPRMM